MNSVVEPSPPVAMGAIQPGVENPLERIVEEGALGAAVVTILATLVVMAIVAAFYVLAYLPRGFMS